MDLSIRSQNKEVLAKYNCLGLEEQTGGKYTIVNHDRTGLYQFLGTYDYERALEILDEIQDILKPKIKLITSKIEETKLNDFSREALIQPMINEVQLQQCESYVYKMPEE